MTEPPVGNDALLRCLRCGFTDAEALECPHCGTLTSAVYLGTDDTCRECGLKEQTRAGSTRHHETYTVSDDRVGTYVFDVTVAKYLAPHSGAPLMEVPEEFVLRFLQVNVTEPRHYEHVLCAIEEPGIVAEIRITDEISTFALLDGSHRAAVRYRDRKPFRAYVLSDLDARCCMLECRPGTVAQEAQHG